MSAYGSVAADVQDAVAYPQYKPRAFASLPHCGGRYLVRGGTVPTLQGDGQPKRFVMVGFDSVEQANRWRNSPAYAPAKAMRRRAATAQMIVVPGA